ncbi:MAG: DUF6600 domain-containing protein [Acidobacteriota bacterium]
MHRTIRPLIAIALTAGLAAPAARADWSVDLYGPHGRVSFGDRDYPEYGGATYYGDFDDALDGYGHWEYVGGYGRCWIPYTVATWRPYSYGSWCWTSYGWSWVSYEPWGYIPHHYGDWRFVGGYGWCWSPGYVWSPANVNWYYRDGFIGWGPSGAFANIDININFINFVNVRNFTSTRLFDHVLSPGRLPSQVISNLHGLAVRPPAPAFIERRTGQRVQAVALAQRSVTVGSHQLKVLAPTGAVKEHALSTGREVIQKHQVVQKVGTPHPVKPQPEVMTRPHTTRPAERPQPMPAPHVSKPTRPQPAPAPYVSKPTRPQPAPAPHVTKPTRPQPAPAPYVSKPTRPQPAPAPHVTKPTRPQPAPAPHVSKPTRPQPAPAPHVSKPTRPQPAPAPHVTKPTRPQPAPAPHVSKPARTQPAPSPHVSKPSREAPAPAKKKAPAPSREDLKKGIHHS